MDRRNFAVCAALLASLGAITGCGSSDVRSVTPAEQAAPRALATPMPEVPRIVEIATETPLEPFALPAEETPQMPSVAVDAALVQVPDSPADEVGSPAVASQIARAQAIEPPTSPDTPADDDKSLAEPRVENVADAAEQAASDSPRASEASPPATDSRLKSEIISAISRPQPKLAKKSAHKRSKTTGTAKAGETVANRKPASDADKADLSRREFSRPRITEPESAASDKLRLDVDEQEAASRVTIKRNASKSLTDTTTGEKHRFKPVWITPLAEPSHSNAAKQDSSERPFSPAVVADAEPKPAAPQTVGPQAQQPLLATKEAPKTEMRPVEIKPLEAPKLEFPNPPNAASGLAQQDEPKPETVPIEIAPAPIARADVTPRGESSQPYPAPIESQRPAMPPLAPSPHVVAERSSIEAHGRAARLPEVMAVISRADQRVGNGFKLAERGAVYLARAEFTAALKLIAEARDVENGNRSASKSVTAALVALKESCDFVRQTSGPENVDVVRILAGHKTTLLKTADVSEMPPTVAADCYYAFAREQFSAAIANEMVGSMALYGLGRSTVASGGRQASQMEYTGQAMSLYQSALAVEPRNFRAANELGVLMANHGQLKLARDMLTRSATLAPNAATWQNLAVVHNRMGDRRLAEQLQAEAKELQQAGRNPAAPSVQWVDPATFAAAAPATDGAMPPLAAAGAGTQPAPAKPPIEPAKPPASVAKKFTDWIPLNLRR